MKKIDVVARCHSGEAKILCYMGHSEGVVFLVSEGGYYASQRGDDITPIGFPEEDVFECPHGAVIGGHIDWEVLSRFRPKEHTANV